MQVAATAAAFCSKWAVPFYASRLSTRLPSNLRLESANKPRLGFWRRMEYFWRGRSTDNRSLIEMLQQGGVIKSRRAADVMEQIDRGLFVPDKDFAYMDSPMPIGFNATISAPHMHALCLELLENHLQPGMHALDVGSGTGYLTACFALMVEEQGYAVGVEHIPELVQQSIENVKKSKAVDLLETGHLSLHVGDGRNGWPDQAPYDAIHVGAAASEIPQALIEQLKPGGRMVIPVGDVFQDLQVVDKQIDGTVKEWSATSVRPLMSCCLHIRDARNRSRWRGYSEGTHSIIDQTYAFFLFFYNYSDTLNSEPILVTWVLWMFHGHKKIYLSLSNMLIKLEGNGDLGRR